MSDETVFSFLAHATEELEVPVYFSREDNVVTGRFSIELSARLDNGLTEHDAKMFIADAIRREILRALFSLETHFEGFSYEREMHPLNYSNPVKQ